MNMLTGPVVYGLAGVAIVLGLAAGVQTVRLQYERTAHAETKADHADVLRGISEKARIAVEAVRRQEQAHASQLAAIDDQHQEDLKDAQDAGNRVVSDLTSGLVRLQDRWAGCAAKLSEAGTGSGEPDAGARDRAESAGRIVEAAAECDAQVRALQAVAKADREVADEVVE